MENLKIFLAYFQWLGKIRKKGEVLMSTILAFSSIILFIVPIIGVVIFLLVKKSRPNRDSERRIRELEEENRNLKNNRGS
jgi:cbb3-type cytochrome oxidase subunit 3